jgi:glycosyltransferase involved in cell wall biosynthesis
MVLKHFGRFVDSVGRHTTLHTAPRQTRLSLLRPASLAAAIRRIDPDIVHTHSGSWYKVARAAQLAGVPVIYTEHGRQFPDPRLHRLLDRRAARLTNHIVAVSRALANYLIRVLDLPDDKVTVIPNGVELRSGAEHTNHRAPVGAYPTVVFGTLGRVERVKGYEVLLTALAQWPSDAPRAQLRIAGDGSQRFALEGLAARLRLGDRVQFEGWLEDPEPFYQSLDAFVLSSYSEGTSIGLLEAMAAGCPPIVTDVGGNRDVLGTELKDWLVRPGDAEALAVKMAALARSPELRRQMGTAARERIQKAYDLTATAHRYADVYRSVLDGESA